MFCVDHSSPSDYNDHMNFLNLVSALLLFCVTAGAEAWAPAPDRQPASELQTKFGNPVLGERESAERSPAVLCFVPGDFPCTGAESPTPEAGPRARLLDLPGHDGGDALISPRQPNAATTH